MLFKPYVDLIKLPSRKIVDVNILPPSYLLCQLSWPKGLPRSKQGNMLTLFPKLEICQVLLETLTRDILAQS